MKLNEVYLLKLMVISCCAITNLSAFYHASPPDFIRQILLAILMSKRRTTALVTNMGVLPRSQQIFLIQMKNYI